MGHLENVLNKVKEKISDYKEAKKEEEKFTSVEKIISKYDQVIDENGEVEDWYHDVGARGGFES